ncbi:MAG: hypothetical protein KGZ91_20935 [Afipia sp.]|jgi:hypothetical protein|nr:hypothetical protein [Afipia sp.]WIG53418.1 MAG: hypothetical protein OJF48_004338 [Afipia sp.]
MSEQLEVLGEILARLIRDKEKFEKLLENPVDAHSDECARQALAGTELLIADVHVQIYKLSADDREAAPGSEPDSPPPATWFRIIE